MKGQRDQHGGITTGRAGVVSRFFFISASLGLLIGLFEAARLWTTPRVIPLLVPDVGWVIWFLAPLADMTFFAVVGLGLGLTAHRTGGRKEIFAALVGGLAITFVFFMLQWFHGGFAITPWDFATDVGIPLIVFVILFAILLMIFAASWNRLSALTEVWIGRMMRPLRWMLATSSIISMVGIGVFVIWPPTSGPAAPMAAAPPTGAPNIVFITLDTVRADHLSSYGYSRPTTPNIDRFARTGVLFENAIAPTSWTLPSHASMFTGLLPQQHGADWAVPLTRSPWTLAEILRSKGYETASFVANELYLQKGWGVAQGFDRYGDERASLRHNLAETLVGAALVQPLYQNFGQYDYFDRENAGQLNSRVFRWLRQGRQRPYFLFINYFDAHNPYCPPAPYNHRFGQLSPVVARRLYTSTVTENQSASLSPADRDSLLAGYDNSLAYLDQQVGNLVSFLRQSPRWQNTIVIITADHGEEFGGHGRYEHGRNLYRGVLHVPLIIAGPEIPVGQRVSHIAGTRQLFSTVLDLAGHGQTPFSRTSLTRFWDPGFKTTTPDSAVVSEVIPPDDLTAQRAMVSLTTPEWHYILHQGGRQELYKWAADPGEQEDLAGAPGEQARLQELRSRLITFVSDATGPWRGLQYLGALDSVKGPARLSLLRPQPFQPGAAGNFSRIGFAQAFFKPDESAPTRPTQAERDLMRSLPYQ